MIHILSLTLEKKFEAHGIHHQRTYPNTLLHRCSKNPAKKQIKECV